MPSATAVLAIFFVIIFITGAAFGALVLFSISIHRTRHVPLSEASAQQRGATSHSVLVTTRTSRKECGR
jgi:hypothetical protein